MLIRIGLHKTTSQCGLNKKLLTRLESALGLMRFKYEIVDALSMHITVKCEKALRLNVGM